MRVHLFTHRDPLPTAARLGLGGLIVVAIAAMASADTARAQTGGPYDLSWSTVDGGGATFLTGGPYALGGTAGQPDAGLLAGGPYELSGGFWFGSAIATGVADGEPPADAPLAFAFHAAAPNPFNPRTTLAFDLPRAGHVELAVYDLRGRRVRVIESAELPSGHHVRHWDGRDDAGGAVASGTYLFTIDAGEFQARQKGLLIK